MKSVLLAAAIAVSAQAQTAPGSAPVRIPTPDGEVVLPLPEDKLGYDGFGFAAVRRAGDTVYISGEIVSRYPSEGTDVAAFKAQARRTFRRLGEALKAVGLTFDDVVMMNTFHVWQGPNFTGTRFEQFRAFADVEREFMTGPKPAWTAVGATALIPDNGIVEVQLIAHVPAKRR